MKHLKRLNESISIPISKITDSVLNDILSKTVLYVEDINGDCEYSLYEYNENSFSFGIKILYPVNTTHSDIADLDQFQTDLVVASNTISEIKKMTKMLEKEGYSTSNKLSTQGYSDQTHSYYVTILSTFITNKNVDNSTNL